MRWWMRTNVQHGVAHAVADWDPDTMQVLTACGRRPQPGGLVLDFGEVLQVAAFACRRCMRCQP